jgi:non-heme chloroperoxidase
MQMEMNMTDDIKNASRRHVMVAGLGLAATAVAASLANSAQAANNDKASTQKTNHATRKDRNAMTSSFITTKDGTQIFYKDWGTGQPIVFHHGWPLSADDWDAQMLFFLDQGYRVIAHDRRGHGRSSQTATGNEMDTYAADVAELQLISI